MYEVEGEGKVQDKTELLGELELQPTCNTPPQRQRVGLRGGQRGFPFHRSCDQREAARKKDVSISHQRCLFPKMLPLNHIFQAYKL